MLTNEQIITLMSFPTEQEAAMLVSALENAGIKTQVSGAFTSGFRAEAPGVVQVLVLSSDEEMARKVLNECQPHRSSNKPKQTEQTPTENYPKNKLVTGTIIVVILIYAVWGLFNAL